jgi:hypothetical protein
MKAPTAKLPNSPRQAAPIAMSAPASMGTTDVVWMPK